jgi:hypothetical protein
MDKLNRLSWEATDTFVAHGVRVGVRVQRGALPKLDGRLPPGTERRKVRSVDRLYSIVGGRHLSRRGVRPFTLLYGDADLLARSVDRSAILTALTDDLQLRVAELTPRRIFVHAGVVGWRGRAIVLPGASFSGKSTLVAAMVRRGATYYSDEYALFDERGRVWPFARPLSLRTRNGTSTRRFEPHKLGRVGAAPLPVGVVWLTEFAQGKQKRPESLSPGRAVLQTLAHTLTVRRRPQAAFTALSAAMQGATLLAGARGAATEAADWLMQECS